MAAQVEHDGGARVKLAVVAILALLILSVAAQALASSVPLHSLPRPVLDAVRARFKGARIASADREHHGGRLVYEVAIKHEGRRIDVTLTPEGAIVWIKTEVAARDLPAAVLRAIEVRYPGATCREAEEVVHVEGERETIAYYELSLLTAEKRTVELRVAADGTIVK